MSKLRTILDIFRYDIPFSKKLNRLYIVIFIAPLLLINFGLASYVAGLLEHQLQYSATANFQQTLQYLKENISNYDTLAFTLSRIDYFQTLYHNQNRMEDYSANEMNTVKRYLEHAIYTTVSRSSIAGFYLYFDGKLGILANGINYFSFDAVKNDIWFREFKTFFAQHRRSFLLCPPAWIRQGEDHRTFYARTICSSENYQDLFGIVRIDIPLTDFTDILNKNSSIDGTISYILNYKQEIIASIGSFPGDIQLENFVPYKTRADDTTGQYKTVLGRDYIVYQAPIGNYRTNLITVIPLNSIRSDSRQLQLAAFLILILLSCIAGFFFKIEFSNLTARVKILIDYMQTTNNGTLTPITEYAGRDEIGQLIVNYNTMVKNLQDFAEYKYQSGMELKSYELQVLQEQINPHFLYNTLEMINWLAKNGRNEKVSVAVDALAQFYQAALGGGKNIVPLQNELAHVQAYVDLQNMRFENVLCYRCEYPEESLSCMVPRTILQPIVENAIIHGILEKESGTGSILVKIEPGDGILRIYIQDDGIGMTAEEAEKLNNGRVNGGYGAANVAKRLRLMYGPGYGLFYQSEKGRGTRVTLTLPATPA
ncbi:MAG: histidine kinase [Treponema sp.]|jgi:two-component system sensor histidine kinase YesM|nr:histidine kinase [Treponema sp.]